MYESGHRVLPSTRDNIQLAAKLVGQGRLVVVPTATIYVIAGSAFSRMATHKIREICNSPLDKPLTTAMVKSMIHNYATMTQREERIVDILLPSPVSLYLNKKDSSLDHAVTYSDAICTFCQKSEITTLCEYAETVLAITSANPYNQSDADTINKAINYFGNAISLYLDGGASRGNHPSAHVDIRKEPVESVRSAPHFPFSRVQEILAQHHLK